MATYRSNVVTDIPNPNTAYNTPAVVVARREGTGYRLIWKSSFNPRAWQITRADASKRTAAVVLCELPATARTWVDPCAREMGYKAGRAYKWRVLPLP